MARGRWWFPGGSTPATLLLLLHLLCVSLLTEALIIRTHDNNSLPPAGGSLEVEREVLSAIEARASKTIANVTINPARVLDDGSEDIQRKILEEEEGDGVGHHEGKFATTHIPGLYAKDLFNSISSTAKNFTYISDSRTFHILQEKVVEEEELEEGHLKEAKEDGKGKEKEDSGEKDVMLGGEKKVDRKEVVDREKKDENSEKMDRKAEAVEWEEPPVSMNQGESKTQEAKDESVEERDKIADEHKKESEIKKEKMRTVSTQTEAEREVKDKEEVTDDESKKDIEQGEGTDGEEKVDNQQEKKEMGKKSKEENEQEVKVPDDKEEVEEQGKPIELETEIKETKVEGKTDEARIKDKEEEDKTDEAPIKDREEGKTDEAPIKDREEGKTVEAPIKDKEVEDKTYEALTKGTEVEGKTDEAPIKDEEVEGKTDEAPIKDEEVEGKTDEALIKEAQVEGKTDEAPIKDEEVEGKTDEAPIKDEEVEGKTDEAPIKDEEVEGKTVEAPHSPEEAKIYEKLDDKVTDDDGTVKTDDKTTKIDKEKMEETGEETKETKKNETEKAESDGRPGKKKSEKHEDKGKKEKKKTVEEPEPTQEPAVASEGAIPDALETYSQFTQRVSAEKKNDVTANGHGGNGHKGPKLKSKNYASPDCGSKLLAANPEATHASKVIQSNKDEYMLNKCEDKIWFIIELCESIRPQKFDIANFELFSNSPKEIQVLGSHRYPTRDWTSMARVTAQEGNRAIQSYRVDNEDFYKYIKVEVLSHYGSEFYCPVSLFRIYGLSEFEVIDTIEDTSEDTDDSDEVTEIVEEENLTKKAKDEGKPSGIPAVLKNMFSGVLDVIKRGYRPNSINNEANDSCYSLHPRFAVDENLCPMAGSLNYILSCYKMEYEALMPQPFVSSAVKNSSFCRTLASTMCSQPEVNDSLVYDTVCNNSYVCVMLSPKHVLAMCFMQDPKIIEGQVACGESASPVAENISTSPPDVLADGNHIPTYVKNAVINTSSITRADATEMNMSKSSETLGVPLSDIGEGTEIVIEPSPEKDEEISQPTSAESSPSQTQKQSQPKETLNANGNIVQEEVVKEDSDATSSEAPKTTEQEGTTLTGMELEDVELTTEDIANIPPRPTTAVPAHVEQKPLSSSPTNKESIVVRLSNKIKALEYNMSISSQYLEELSRRYKRQMEEMQKQFDLTIAALNDTSRQAYERDQEHQRDIETLETQLNNMSQILEKLVEERENLAHTVVEQHLLLMAVEVVVLCIVFTMCYRRRLAYNNQEGGAVQEREQTPCDETEGSEGHKSRRLCLDDRNLGRVRRRSVDSITRERSSRLRQRRPSEEALNNLAGTYEDLLIIEPAIPIMMDSVVDRKRKKKSSSMTLKRSKSNASIEEKPDAMCRRARRIEKLNMSSAGVLFCGNDGVEVRQVDLATPLSSPDSPDSAIIPYELFYNSQEEFFPDSVDKGKDACVLRPMVREIDPGENRLPGPEPLPTKRHSLSCCPNCDNHQKRIGKLSKSVSLCSDSEKHKHKDKIKKIKKLKRIKDIKSERNVGECVEHNTLNDDYSYCTTNGTYCQENYENHHGSVHFSEDTKLNGDQSPSYNHSLGFIYADSYTNGIDSQSSLYVGNNVLYADQRIHDSERKKVIPKAKTKVKLRSDNWEWYSNQHVGGNSSETVSTSSDSSGKGRRVKTEEKKNFHNGVGEDKRKKKKSKSKSPVLEEEAIIEREPGI